MFRKYIISLLSGVALLLISASSFAQQTTILIKDAATNEIIEHVSFIYGTQKGHSGKSGKISLLMQEGAYLILSHISYNEYILTADQLKKIIPVGVISLESVTPQMLNPVTVYGLKGKLPQKSLRLNHGDWVQHDAGGVLQQIPGFSAIRKSGAFGFDPVYRGFKLEQLSILNDGALTAIAACPNRMDPPTSQIMINQTEQIEVMKGPHSFRYGPAMGAVINFKSAIPEFSVKSKLFGRINTGYESNGEVYRTEGLLGIQTGKLHLSAAASYSAGNDYKDGRDSVMPASFNRGAINLNAAYKIKEQQLLTFTATRNFARNTDFAALGMDLLSDDTWLLQTGYKVSSKTKWYSNWNTQLYTSFVEHSMGNQLRPTSATMLMYTDAATQTTGGRTEFTVQRKKTVLYFGADGKFETVDGNRTRKMITGMMAGKEFIDTVWQNSSNTRGGIFTDLHQQLGLYKLSVAGRLDVVYAKADNLSAKFKTQYSDATATDINPSISAGISRQFSNNWYAGIWIGRGMRSAGITERFINSLTVGLDPYEMLGNPQIKPEANNQADITVAYKSEKSSVELNAFASVISNYISSVINTAVAPRITTAPGVRQYINIKDARLYGFEFSWLQQWIPELQQQISLTYVYGENRITDNPLPEISPMEFRYKLEGALWNKKLMPNLAIRYAGKQDRVAADFGEKKTSSFTTVDIGVKAIPVKNVQLSLAVTNLMNQTYREHLSRYMSSNRPLNAPGRSFVAMLVYSF